jgi:predicted ribosome quality control (RQC) complex YloA/Tae2 family protein
MDRKRELTSVDLRALARELGGYEGAAVDKAYLYPEDDLLRLKMRDYDRGRLELLIEVGERKRANLTDPERVPDAPERPPEFAKMLRNRISGATFAGVEQFGFDRILTFSFERPDEDTTVVAELFGDGNVAVLDGNGEVVDCIETVRLKSRTVVPGAVYEYPESRLNPLELDYEGFRARMEESDTDLVRTLATVLNFGGLWGEELCTRAVVEKTRSIADADDEEYRALYDTLDRLRADLEGGVFDPRVYFEEDEGNDDEGRRVDVTPVPMEERSALRAEVFETFDAALDDYFYHFGDEETATAGVTEPDRPDFEAEIERRKHIIEQQEGAIENFERQAERHRENAEALYGHYSLVDEILTTVRAARDRDTPWEEIQARFDEGKERGIEAAEAVVGVDEREGTVTVSIDGREVTLDPAEGVEHNANRLYEEAKRVAEKREGALEAVENTRSELRDLEERREEWDRKGPPEQETDEPEDTRTAEDWLSMPSIPVRRREQWYERFRWFRTSDGFLVLGGRDADQNEDLVKKYLERGDRFFHTQARGGPVTVLKAADPSESARNVSIPDRSREEAARFAVSYSSVWKEGRYAGDVYEVGHDQVSKTPESGEFLEKGAFAVRGDRTYHDGTPVGVSVGITCEPDTRVVGGPPEPIEARAVTTVAVEPGGIAQSDVAKRVYRRLRERFTDTGFVRKVASPDRIAHFLPPGGSRIAED